jgi:transglutaminase-like putative cysteine protease
MRNVPDMSAEAPLRYRCRHATRYEYEQPVVGSHLVAHLAPRPRAGQTGRLTRLVIEPQPAVLIDRVDWFGNPVHYAAVEEPHGMLSVETEMEVEVRIAAPAHPGCTAPWETIRAAATQTVETADFLARSSRVDAARSLLAAYARSCFPDRVPVAVGCHDLMHRIHTDFAFDPQATTVSTPVAEVFANRRGVCQDFAHLMIGMLRSLGLPARYVSGYIRTVPPGTGAWRGAESSHAWVQAWCGQADGWLDLDPTNAVAIGTDHLTVAWGRDYDDVSPLRGVILGGGRHLLHVGVQVDRVDSPTG